MPSERDGMKVWVRLLDQKKKKRISMGREWLSDSNKEDTYG